MKTDQIIDNVRRHRPGDSPHDIRGDHDLNPGMEVAPDLTPAAVLGGLVFFAALESIVGFCTGCFVFGYLMRWGVIPKEICEKCNNLNLGQPAGGGP